MKVMVLKKNLKGEVVWKYEGVVLRRDETSLTLEAWFDREDRPFMDTTLKKGDRFVEWYYANRWYNIYEIYDRDDGRLKGWYCNVSTPAVIEDGLVSYVDLALDLWVSADGRQTVLDEEEFAALELSPAWRERARQGLEELKGYFASPK